MDPAHRVQEVHSWEEVAINAAIVPLPSHFQDSQLDDIALWEGSSWDQGSGSRPDPAHTGPELRWQAWSNACRAGSWGLGGRPNLGYEGLRLGCWTQPSMHEVRATIATGAVGLKPYLLGGVGTTGRVWHMRLEPSPETDPTTFIQTVGPNCWAPQDWSCRLTKGTVM